MAAKYLLVYHGGSEPATPEEGNQVRDNWMAWFSKLGSAVSSSTPTDRHPNPTIGVSGPPLIKRQAAPGPAIGWP